ncbi:potassium channel family protein [Streptomyces coriariae]|uniref:potassium channel family protein n=1 Tax=Streptomyces coriariae TaxID=2864460 RepID=UPI001E60D67F|nr:potassium channel family protein [Streptomyces coriariae]
MAKFNHVFDFLRQSTPPTAVGSGGPPVLGRFRSDEGGGGLLLFATAYFPMDHSASDSFSDPLSRSDALYSTVTVCSTVGFGDIGPRSEPQPAQRTAARAANRPGCRPRDR